MHHFPLSKKAPQDKSSGGYRIKATKSNFPVLRGMSLYKIVLHPLAFREPHWHANADELGYCLAGSVLVSLYTNGNHREKVLVSPGEAFFIPSGSLHAIENVGDTDAELILQFSNEEPEDFGLSATFSMLRACGNHIGILKLRNWGMCIQAKGACRYYLLMGPLTRI